MKLSEIKTALRNGQYAWPGGYQMYFVTSDGEALSFETVRAEWKQVIWSHLIGFNGGWHIAGADINWEDADLICAHTNKPIPSAYGEA